MSGKGIWSQKIYLRWIDGKEIYQGERFQPLGDRNQKGSMTWKIIIWGQDDDDLVMVWASGFSLTWTGKSTRISSKDFTKSILTQDASDPYAPGIWTKKYKILHSLMGIPCLSRNLGNGEFKYLNFALFGKETLRQPYLLQLQIIQGMFHSCLAATDHCLWRKSNSPIPGPIGVILNLGISWRSSIPSWRAQTVGNLLGYLWIPMLSPLAREEQKMETGGFAKLRRRYPKMCSEMW